MSPFVSGALGAASVLLLAGLVRRALWLGQLHHAGRGGRSFMMRRLYRKLGTRPEQEQVMSAEADALAAELRALREEGRGLRAELADLVAGPALDSGAVKAKLEGRLAKLEAVKARAAEAVAKVHAALEPRQREELAELLRRGPRGHHHHGMHHGMHHA